LTLSREKIVTISLSWTRKVGKVKELVVASDSRLSFGCRWDCCPKILALPRNDSFISFAGNTMYAYPVMLQAVTAVAQHGKLLSRGTDLCEVKGHLLRVLNNMVSLIHDFPTSGADNPDTTFLLGGWSWEHSQFKVWLLHYDASIRKFTYCPLHRWTGLNRDKVLAFTGDYEVELKERLLDLLRKKNKIESGGFDMEPLEVLRDMLRDPAFYLIGGAPQLMKVYRYCNYQPYGIFWPDKAAGTISLLGRPLLEYERSKYLILDVDTMKTVKHDIVPLPIAAGKTSRS
jgi:hypothetical protein